MADTTRTIRVRIASETSGLSRGVNTAERQLAGLERAVQRTNRAGALLGRGLAGLGRGLAVGAAAGIAAAGAGLVKFTRDASAAAREAQLADKRLGAIFKTTGLSAKRLDAATKTAGKLSEVIGVDDDDIKAVQALGATFPAMAKDVGVFDRATRAAFDLQAAGFGKAEGNIKQLGKALADPTKGMGALARAGVTFTDAEKAKIKALQESGDLLGAQEILLKAVEGQVGGTAEATATASSKLRQAWDNTLTGFGAGFVDDLDKIYEALTSTLGDPAVQDAISGLGDALGDVLGGLAGDIGDIDAQKIADFINGLAEKLPEIVPAMKDFAEGFGDFAAGVKDATAPTAGGAWTVITATGDALAKLPEGWRDDAVALAAVLGLLSKVKGVTGVLKLPTLGGTTGVMNVKAGVVNVQGAGTPTGKTPAGSPTVTPTAPAVPTIRNLGKMGGIAGVIETLMSDIDDQLNPRNWFHPKEAKIGESFERIFEKLPKDVWIQPHLDPAAKGMTEDELETLSDERDAKLIAIANTKVADGLIDESARDRLVKLLGDADTAQAEGRIDGAARDRIVGMLAKGDVHQAEEELNKASRKRTSTVKADAETGKAERDLNHTARDRNSTVTAKASTSEANRQLNDWLSLPRSIRVNVHTINLPPIADGGPVGRASGGAVKRAAAGMYLVGEKGPELFLPHTSGYVQARQTTASIIRTELGRAQGYQPAPTVKVYVDGQEVTARVRRDVVRTTDAAVRAYAETVA